jgi:hypothetical protein
MSSECQSASSPAGNICHVAATYTSEHKLSIPHICELDSAFPFVLFDLAVCLTALCVLICNRRGDMFVCFGLVTKPMRVRAPLFLMPVWFVAGGTNHLGFHFVVKNSFGWQSRPPGLSGASGGVPG